jgi:hypothetical protein
MSEPSQWGPPRFDAAPRPTAPHPTAPHPAGHRPPVPPPAYQDRTAFLATAPIPTVRAEVPPNPTRRSRTPDVDYDDYDSGRPRRRGQIFSGLVVLLALAAAALTYYLTYQTLASVRVTSGDGLGGVGGQVMSLVGVLFGALVVFVLALIALVIARPKALAGLGLAASLLLPVAALVLGLWYGGAVLRQNVESEIAQAGPEVAAQGAAAVADAIVQELENRGIDAGPVRDLIRSAVGS